MEQTFHMLLFRAFHAQRSVLRPLLTSLGLGTGQPRLLGYLSRNGASTQREIADYYEIDPAAVCRMLDSLQKNGFVTREANEKDKRRDLVQITPAGRQAYAAWQQGCRQMETKMLAGFSQQEREMFADCLSRAYQNLRAEKEERL